MNKKKLSVSFSGGRTSAYMAKWLLDNKQDEYEMPFIFANTGLEHEKTLDFVNECDKRWGLDLVWVEAVVHHGERKGTTHKVVTYETASRNGKPFYGVCEKYGLPEAAFPHCTRELKLSPMNSWIRENFNKKPYVAIGIRADEIDRVTTDYQKKMIIYPLAFMNPKTKGDIRHWWNDQDFDLDVPEHMGNCVTCWKKSDRKLMTIAKNEPSRFDVFKDLENKYCRNGAGIEGATHGRRFFFRRHRTVDDIIASSKQPFVEFVDHMPELQLGLLDELDESNGCSESCEVYTE